MSPIKIKNWPDVRYQSTDNIEEKINIRSEEVKKNIDARTMSNKKSVSPSKMYLNGCIVIARFYSMKIN